MNHNVEYVQNLIASSTELDRVHFTDRPRLVEDYFKKNVPCVVTGLADDWKTKDWTFDFFKKTYGDRQMVVARQNPETQEKEEKEILLADYIDYVTKNDENPEAVPFYLNTMFTPPDELYNDFDLPDDFTCLLNNLKGVPDFYPLSWIYVAPKNSVTALHRDIANTSAWNLVISGCKIWVFYPETHLDMLDDLKINPYNPNFAKHPWLKSAKPMVCVQKPGEIVYTPSGMWHAVLNIEKGISLTENYVGRYNLKLVKRFCREVGLTVPGLDTLLVSDYR
jgi:histone arginine demethylase JMJD6